MAQLSRRNLLKSLAAVTLLPLSTYAQFSYTQEQTRVKPPSWPNSDTRMDTTFAYPSATLDPAEFANIVGMALLLELDVYRIEDLRAGESGGYEGTLYRGDSIYKQGNPADWHMYELITPLVITPQQADFVKSYYPGFFANSSPDRHTQYWRFRELLRKKNPQQLIGSYITGSNCRDQVSTDIFPQDMIDCHRITPIGHAGLNHSEPTFKEIFAGKWSIHPTDTANLQIYQDLLVDEALARNVDFLFLDNMHLVSYINAKKEEEIAFAQAFIAHIDTVSSRLNEVGCRAIYNLGKLPHWLRQVSDSQTRQTLENAFDAAIGQNGIFLEASFQYRNNAELAKWEMEKLCALLKQGSLVCLGGPYPASHDNRTAAEWMAAMALLIRKPGDPLFISTDRALDSKMNFWKDWPSFYGKPLGQTAFTPKDDKNWYAQANFEHGQIIVVHIAVPWQQGQTSNASLPISTSGYTLVPDREPQRGKWDPTSEQYMVDDPHIDATEAGHSDWFILGAKKDPSKPFYQQIIAVDVTIES